MTMLSHFCYIYYWLYKTSFPSSYSYLWDISLIDYSQVGAVDKDGNSAFTLILERIEKGEMDLSEFDWFVRHWIIKGPDEFGQTILHFAAQRGLVR